MTATHLDALLAAADLANRTDRLVLADAMADAGDVRADGMRLIDGVPAARCSDHAWYLGGIAAADGDPACGVSPAVLVGLAKVPGASPGHVGNTLICVGFADLLSAYLALAVVLAPAS